MQHKKAFSQLLFFPSSPVLCRADLHLLPRDHRPLRDQLQAGFLAALAAGLHLPRQPPPVLPRQLRVQHRVVGQGECQVHCIAFFK